MTKADRPASTRTVSHGAAQLPAYSFDPIMDQTINACNRHWTDLFFVSAVSWVDIDG